MYQPPAFREDRTDVLHGLVRAYPFATLVTLGADGIAANHLPMIFHADEGAQGVLRGHVARPNPVWRDVDPAAEALAIFQGPHHYVTPSWYPSKAAHGRVVPTWNYCVVHAYGTLSAVEDPDRLRDHLDALTAVHEAGRAAPWAVGDAPADYVEKMIGGIVGLDFAITRIAGKWKMSQNRGEADRRGVRDGLEAENSDAARAVSQLVPPAPG